MRVQRISVGIESCNLLSSGRVNDRHRSVGRSEEKQDQKTSPTKRFHGLKVSRGTEPVSTRSGGTPRTGVFARTGERNSGSAPADADRLDPEALAARFFCARRANVYIHRIARDVIAGRVAAEAALTFDRGMRCSLSKCSYHTDDIFEYRDVQHLGCSVTDGVPVSTRLEPT